MKLRHAQFEIKPADAELWMNLMRQSLDEVLGDKFPEEKAEMIAALDDQAKDLVTTEEDGTRVYGPLDRVTYARQLQDLKESYQTK
jgi:truncated hemoglobin YjbI